jgi:GxxExxY protein
MPIHLPQGLRLLGETEFKQVAYEVMQVVFAVHNEMGRLFDETIYQHAVAERVRGSRLEVPLEARFKGFCKKYYLDLLVADGAVFELKVAEAFVDRHRAQLLNYLLMAELRHGKLVNLGGDLVAHEFVNATLTHEDRVAFQVDDKDYQEIQGNSGSLRDVLVAILRDWGTCLDLELYEEAIVHFLGGPQQVVKPVDVYLGGARLGQQRLNLISPGTSVCISALNDGQSRYGDQLRRFLGYTGLKAIQWVNVGRKLVSFRTIRS